MELKIRFKHIKLKNQILTICVNKNLEKITFGWCINPAENWIRKKANEQVKINYNETPLNFDISKDEPVISDYINLRILLIIFSKIIIKTKKDIFIQHTIKKIIEETITLLSCRIIKYHYIAQNPKNDLRICSK